MRRVMCPVCEKGMVPADQRVRPARGWLTPGARQILDAAKALAQLDGSDVIDVSHLARAARVRINGEKQQQAL